MIPPSSGPRLRLLSHPLSPSTPAYGGGESLVAEPLTSIAGGDTANTTKLHLPNHLGTHVDLPRHFFDSGATLTDLPPDAWWFEHPVIMDVPVSDGDLITLDDLPGPIPTATDLLILRTGHERHRGTDAFWQRGPGLSADLGTALRTLHPTVRAVGVDLISVTSRLQRAAGRAAHRAFLDPDAEGAPVLLIEDMALAEAPEALGSVLVSPLLVEDGDGGPVTIWSFIGDS